MKKYLGVLIVSLMISCPSLVCAEAVQTGPYFSLFIGGSAFKDTAAVNSDFVTGTSFNENIKFNPGVYFGGNYGYDFGLVRLEGELAYRWASIDRITSQTNAYRISEVDGSMGVASGMMNLFLDLHNDSPITPYVGGGVGVATLSMSDTFGYVSNGVSTRYETLYLENDKTVFAYQVGGGLDLALGRHFALDLGYRYFRTNEAHFDTYFPISNSLRSDNHNVRIGFKVKF